MNEDFKKIGQLCKCGEDKWHIKDETNLYKMICMNCYNVICIDKREYVNKFQCKKCGCLSGTLEENDYKVGVRCSNCHELFIKLEKNPCESTRNQESSQQLNQPKCPKCGNTEFVPLRRKWSLLTGFATNKVDMVCSKCGTVRK